MLSAESSKIINKLNKKSYPLLSEPRTVRVKFRKVGNLQYISHLDLQRTFARILVRAGIPMWYTQGFNPHAKVTFALPLSVGTESLCEYIDLRIDREMSCEEIMQRLNNEVTEEMRVLDVYIPQKESEFQSIAYAAYDMQIQGVAFSQELATEVQNYLTTSPLLMDKKSKSGIHTVDITSMIHSLTAAVQDDGTLLLQAVLSAAGAEYLNPDYLLRALREHFGTAVLCNDPMKERTSILRTHVLLADAQTEFH